LFASFARQTLKGKKPEPPVNIPQSLRDLIYACLATTPSQRPQFPEIVSRLVGVIEDCKQLEYKEVIHRTLNGDAEGAVRKLTQLTRINATTAIY